MKSSKQPKLKRDQIILIAALILGLLAVIYYLLSGRGSFDQNFRDLQNSDAKVQAVSSTEGQNGEKEVEIKCKDGSSYDIYYPPGEKDYSSVAAGKCKE